MTKIYDSHDDIERERLERKLHRAEKGEKAGLTAAAVGMGVFEIASASRGETRDMLITVGVLAGVGLLGGGYALASHLEANKLKDKLATLAPEKVIITQNAHGPAPATQISAAAYEGTLQKNVAAQMAF